MSTWIQLYEAHRVSALTAWGYWNEEAGSANMSAGFATTLIDSWQAIGRKALTPSGMIPGSGSMVLPSQSPYQAAAPFVQQQIDHLEEDRSVIASNWVTDPQRIWNHVFQLASVLDGGGIPFPSLIDSFVESAKDAATYVKDTTAKAIDIVSPAVMTALKWAGLTILGLATLYVVIKAVK